MTELKKFLPKRMALPPGHFNHSFIDAVDKSHQNLLSLIQTCIDQLFLTTATGKYLVQLGEEQGFVMPLNSGLDIRAYRVLVPLMVSSPKQVRRTIEEIVEAFYGMDRTRPSITASVYEPYSLVSGDDIIIKTEKETVSLSILSNQVSDISSVAAAELAAIINATQSTIYADTVSDRATAKKFLRLTNTTVGAIASIQCAGGTLQNLLKFPNLVATNQMAGTNWLVTKQQTYSDVTKFQWDGVGFNPKMYLVKVDDVVTIRNLPVGPNHSNLLNGSFKIVDSGYDYFIIRNTSFDLTSTSVTQPNDNNFVFTSKTKVTLYDNSEYGLASETDFETATITVPAIPPLARRFLSGSTHLHGVELSIESFTRSSITLTLPLGVDPPPPANHFVLKNNRMMYDFRKPYYQTTGSDNQQHPTYFVQSGDTSFSILPCTSPTGIGSDPFHCEVDSSEIIIDFPFPSGLTNGWGFSLANCTGIGNINASDLNKEHITYRLDSLLRIVCKLSSPFGFPIVFSGVSFGTFNIHRYNVALQDGSDFYLEFPADIDVVNSGLQVNMTFKIDPSSGLDQEAFYADQIKHRILYVNSIVGNVVNITTGFGAGGPSDIIANASGFRSTDFGGSSVTYFFDMASTWNSANVMPGLRLVMLDYEASVNANYVGSYVFDPQGVSTLFTVSKFITRATDTVLKGSNLGIIFVDKIDNVFGAESFPNSGEILIDYGTDNIEGPISYIAVISSQTGSSQILIDPSYRFKKTHTVGSQVQFIHTNKPYQPSLDGTDYPVYVTGTAQSRNTLFTLLEGLIAGGVFLQPDVLLPQLRYQDTAIPPFE